MNRLAKAKLLMLALLYSAGICAQQTKDTAVVKKMVADKHYVFKAETVMPMGGTTRHLSTDYDVKITKDTVQAYLPYFGRAYSAPIGQSEGGIIFLSKNFEYTVTDKKGGWDITIKPKDVRDVQQLNFSIFNNGSTNLNVTSTNRQPISFGGHIDPPDNRKKKS